MCLPSCWSLSGDKSEGEKFLEVQPCGELPHTCGVLPPRDLPGSHSIACCSVMRGNPVPPTVERKRKQFLLFLLMLPAFVFVFFFLSKFYAPLGLVHMSPYTLLTEPTRLPKRIYFQICQSTILCKVGLQDKLFLLI